MLLILNTANMLISAVSTTIFMNNITQILIPNIQYTPKCMMRITSWFTIWQMVALPY